jgi:predicted DNA-binding protein
MKKLTSFRLPQDLKDQFATICEIKGTFMSTELIYLLESFIDEQLSDKKIAKRFKCKIRGKQEPKEKWLIGSWK